MVFEKLRTIICEQFEANEDDVTPDTTIDDLGADSLDLIDLVMSIEDTFGVEVPDEAIDSLACVDDLVKFIESNK